MFIGKKKLAKLGRGGDWEAYINPDFVFDKSRSSGVLSLLPNPSV
jgi:hypothetical protein